MRARSLCSLLIGALGLLCAQPAGAQRIERSQLGPVKGGMEGEQSWERTIELGKDVSLPAKLEVTAKGNGILEVGNLKLKVYDGHDDGAYYDNDLLNVEFVDVTRDGYKDLVVSGDVLYTGDDDQVKSVEPVVFLYVFVPEQKQFVQTYKRASFDLEKGPQARD